MTDALTIQALSVAFDSGRATLMAIRDVSLRVPRGQVLGVVGESGSGKSTIANAVLRLLSANGRITAGRIMLDGVDLTSLSERAMEKVRGDRLTVVFQDPMTTLNPVLSIATQMVDIQFRNAAPRHEKRARAAAALASVGINDAERRLDQFPHELSGGMRQRIAIAMAIMAKPALLIADEPTTALDATLEVQILRLFRELQRAMGLSILLITHHLGLVAELADRVAVIYAGEVVEEAAVRDIFYRPRHPYTQRLLECDPARARIATRRLAVIEGVVPDLARLPAGCAFAARCHVVLDRCRRDRPSLTVVEGNHVVACHRSSTQYAP